ncbi:MAG: hypothetical protein U0N99_08660, partial [Collinsella sp.]
ILLVVQKAKCVDQLLDIRLVKHVLDIHRSPPNPPKGIEVDTDIGHRSPVLCNRATPVAFARSSVAHHQTKATRLSASGAFFRTNAV